MIEYGQAFWLALIQGLTEFLPISSSAHLILLPRFVNWSDQGLAFDVAVHMGTLIAVVGYFREDFKSIGLAWFRQWGDTGASVESRTGWLLIQATVPAVIAGFLLNKVVEGALRDPIVIAISTIVFGLLLWWADQKGRRTRKIEDLQSKDALLIGLFQAVALIPGTSRSGITMTAGLMLGLSRKDAARFSFLMAVPIIAAAGCLKAVALISEPGQVSFEIIVLGISVSFVTAWVVIALFLRSIEQIGMTPFVLYRLVLGLALLAWFW